MCVCVEMNEPFEENSKGSNDCSSKGMTINDEDIVRHAAVEGNFGDDIHAGIAELQRYHSKIGFRGFEEVATAA